LNPSKITKKPPKKGALICQPQARRPEAKPHAHYTWTNDET